VYRPCQLSTGRCCEESSDSVLEKLRAIRGGDGDGDGDGGADACDRVTSSRVVWWYRVAVILERMKNARVGFCEKCFNVSKTIVQKYFSRWCYGDPMQGSHIPSWTSSAAIPASDEAGRYAQNGSFADITSSI